MKKYSMFNNYVSNELVAKANLLVASDKFCVEKG